jgi:hypothetical protein
MDESAHHVLAKLGVLKSMIRCGRILRCAGYNDSTHSLGDLSFSSSPAPTPNAFDAELVSWFGGLQHRAVRGEIDAHVHVSGQYEVEPAMLLGLSTMAARSARLSLRPSY